MYSLSHFQLPVCQAGHVSVTYRHRQGHIGSYFVVITGRAGNYRDYLLQFHRQGKNLTRCFDRLQAGQEFFETYTRLFVSFQAGQDFSHETFRHILRRGHS